MGKTAVNMTHKQEFWICRKLISNELGSKYFYATTWLCKIDSSSSSIFDVFYFATKREQQSAKSENGWEWVKVEIEIREIEG